MRNLMYLIFLTISISCSSKKEEKDQIVDNQPTEKSLYDKTKDIFIDSDEIKNQNRQEYLEEMITKHPEYKLVSTFFQEPNNEYLLESNGDFYKIIDSQIADAGSIVYKHENSDILKYFYKAKENVYIYNFSLVNKQQIKCIGIRRIENGMFKTDMHDLIFENNKLVKEDFKGKYSTKFYNKNNIQYFRFSNKVNGDEIINTLNLGPVKNF